MPKKTENYDTNTIVSYSDEKLEMFFKIVRRTNIESVKPQPDENIMVMETEGYKQTFRMKGGYGVPNYLEQQETVVDDSFEIVITDLKSTQETRLLLSYEQLNKLVELVGKFNIGLPNHPFLVGR